MANKVEIIINADGTRAIKAMQDVGATARATGKANAEASKATALAAKFAGDTIKLESIKIIEARERERDAAKDYAQIQALTRKGAIEEAAGARTAAAAYQRLTAAKLETAIASEKHLQAMKKEGHEWATLRERLGGGMTIGGSLGESMLGMASIAAIAGAGMEMKSAVKESLEFGEALKRQSESTGLAVSTLSVLQYATKVTGGDVDKATMAVGRLDKMIGEAAAGDVQAQAYMKDLGLNAKDLAGRTDGVEIAFRRFAEVMANAPAGISKTYLAMGVLGHAGMDQIPTLTELGTHWDEYTKQAKDAGRYMDELSAEKLEALNKKLLQLDEHIAGAKLAFTEGLTPGLSQFFDALSDGEGPMSVFVGLGERLGAVLNLAAAAAYGLASGTMLVASIGDGGRFTRPGREAAAQAASLDAKAQKFREAMVDGNPSGGAQSLEGGGNGTKPPGKSKEQIKIDDIYAAGKAKKAAAAAAALLMARYQTEREAQQTLGAQSEEKRGLLSAQADADFWKARIDNFAKGSKEYLDLQKKITEDEIKQSEKAIALQRSQREKAVQAQKYVDGLGDGSREMADAHKRIAEMTKESDKATQEANKTRYEDQGATLAMVRDAQASAAMADLREREFMVQAYGSHDGNDARSLARIHEQQYGIADERLAQKTATTQADPFLSAKEKDTQLARLDQERTRLAEERNLQDAEDQMRIESTTLMGGMNDALRDFARDATDAGAAMKEWLGSSISTVNNTIVKSLTTRAYQNRGAWGGAGHDIFTNATGHLVKNAEGRALDLLPKGAKGFLGLGGKKDGSSKANALWVLDAAAAQNKALDGKMAALPGGVAKIAESASSGGGTSMWGKPATTAMSLIPGFADGGEYPTNSLIMVGERGPEVMRTGSTGGSIIPNHALGGTTHHMPIHVDARGSSNPAQTMAMVHQAILQAAPHIAAATKQSIRSDNARVAPSARKF